MIEMSTSDKMEANTTTECSSRSRCQPVRDQPCGRVSPPCVQCSRGARPLMCGSPVSLRITPRLLMLTLLLVSCGGPISARTVDKLHTNDAGKLDIVQQTEQKLDKNSADTHVKHEGGFGSGPLCTPGHTEQHPLYSCKYLECSSSFGHLETRTCPSGTDYDIHTGECSLEEPVCNDVTEYVPRIVRLKRALDDENADGSANTVTESADIGPDLDNKESENQPAAAPEALDSGVTEAKVDKDDAVTTKTPARETTEEKQQTTPKAKMSTAAMSTNATEAPTTAEQTTASTTTKVTSPEIVIPEEPVSPPYVIITDPPSEATTAKNITVIADPEKGAKTGAIIGIIVALVAVVIIVVVIVVLVKKKKINVGSAKLPVKRKKKIVTRMENPQYGPGQTYRFSSDSTLQVGPTSVTLTKFNNPNLGETPLPKVLQMDSPSRQRQGSLPRSIASRRDKRKAPVPPNPFGDFDNDDQGDLYEKASHGSMELQTFTVRNENATEADDNDNEPSYPLLKKKDKDAEKSSSLENGKVKKARAPPAPEAEGGADDSLLQNTDKRKSAASADKVSADFTLDEYDLTNNPFFTKT